jgi:membrane protease YdiL (CAAX protease family)
MTTPSPELIVPALPVPDVSMFGAWLRSPLVTALAPLPILALVAPAVWWFFRSTWKELDEEAQRRGALGHDYQAHVALALLAITLTLQEYYGGRNFFVAEIFPYLVRAEEAGLSSLQTAKFSELYTFGYWVFARLVGYVVLPITLWKLLFPKVRVLDMGLHTKGFFSHIGLYGLCLGVVLLAMTVVGRNADFAAYYPFYRAASRSWFDLLVWESIYFLQFFGLEFYFRGFLLEAFRYRMGSAAIFAMAVPYCMIHFGKPYLETHGAIIAGVVLGSLAIKTRSIYAGFLVHITVAGAMDVMALYTKGQIPTHFWP